MNKIKISKMLLAIATAIGIIVGTSNNVFLGRKLYLAVKGIEQLEIQIKRSSYISADTIQDLNMELQMLNALDGEIPKQAEYTSIIDVIHHIRIILKDNAIQSSRFRIINDSYGETAEFVLHSSPNSFFNFLSELSTLQGLDIRYLTIKPEPGTPPTLTITIRIKHET